MCFNNCIVFLKNFQPSNEDDERIGWPEFGTQLPLLRGLYMTLESLQQNSEPSIFIPNKHNKIAMIRPVSKILLNSVVLIEEGNPQT